MDFLAKCVILAEYKETSKEKKRHLCKSMLFLYCCMRNYSKNICLLWWSTPGCLFTPRDVYRHRVSSGSSNGPEIPKWPLRWLAAATGCHLGAQQGFLTWVLGSHSLISVSGFSISQYGGSVPRGNILIMNIAKRRKPKFPVPAFLTVVKVCPNSRGVE